MIGEVGKFGNDKAIIFRELAGKVDKPFIRRYWNEKVDARFDIGELRALPLFTQFGDALR